MMVPGALTGHGHGKLLLFGEHAAVYGHPALGIGLPWTLELTIRPFPAPGRSSSRRSAERYPPLPEPLAAMLGARYHPAVVEVRSQIPVGLGFGSSAALCVAAERALAAAGEGPRSAAAVWQGAHERERVFHGTPSGADTGLATHRGVGFLTWQRGAGALPAYEPVAAAELHLVVAAVPRRGDTRAHVAAVGQRVCAGDAATRETLRCLGQCSTEAKAILLEPAPSAAALGAVADRAQRMLAALGLGDPDQERLLRDGRAAGASGGKLSGAGGGGACFLVCRDAATATRVLAAVATPAATAAHVAVGTGDTRHIAPVARPETVARWRFLR
jgi:mevalonate kinase